MGTKDELRVNQSMLRLEQRVVKLEATQMEILKGRDKMIDAMQDQADLLLRTINELSLLKRKALSDGL